MPTTVIMLADGTRATITDTADPATGAVLYRLRAPRITGLVTITPHLSDPADDTGESEQSGLPEAHLWLGALSHSDPAACFGLPLVDRHTLVGDTYLPTRALRWNGDYIPLNTLAKGEIQEAPEPVAERIRPLLRTVVMAWRRRPDLPHLATAYRQATAPQDPTTRPVLAAPLPDQVPVPTPPPSFCADGDTIHLRTAAGDRISAAITIRPTDHAVIYRVTGPRATGAVLITPDNSYGQPHVYDQLRLQYGIGSRDEVPWHDERTERLTVNGVPLGGNAIIHPRHIDPRYPWRTTATRRHGGGETPDATEKRAGAIAWAVTEHYLTRIDPRVRQAAIADAAPHALHQINSEITTKRERLATVIRELGDLEHTAALLTALIHSGGTTTTTPTTDDASTSDT